MTTRPPRMPAAWQPRPGKILGIHTDTGNAYGADIDHAWSLLCEKPRRPVRLPVQPWAAIVRGSLRPGAHTWRYCLGLNRAIIDAADTDQPVILATMTDPLPWTDRAATRLLLDPKYRMVIDGWHRIARAILDDRATLPAFILDADEAAAVVRPRTDLHR